MTREEMTEKRVSHSRIGSARRALGEQMKRSNHSVAKNRMLSVSVAVAEREMLRPFRVSQSVRNEMHCAMERSLLASVARRQRESNDDQDVSI